MCVSACVYVLMCLCPCVLNAVHRNPLCTYALSIRKIRNWAIEAHSEPLDSQRGPELRHGGLHAARDH